MEGGTGEGGQVKATPGLQSAVASPDRHMGQWNCVHGVWTCQRKQMVVE